MKKLLIMTCVALAIGTLCAGVVFDHASVVFNPMNGGAEISYALTEGPAIVTMEIQTNALANGEGEWLPVNGTDVQHIDGDINRIVRTVGERCVIRWKAHKDIPDRVFTNGTIRAVLTAWATNAPPDWLVVGLSSANDVHFYATTNDLPQGFCSDIYKTTHLLMRKIPAAGVTWMMGTPLDEYSARDANREIQHRVMHTEDYYMGVYEVTQGQYTNMCDKANPSTQKNDPDSPLRPVENVGVRLLRGQQTLFGADDYWWPHKGHQVRPGCVLDQLRKKTGLDGFDLPTSSEWEYACRAGTHTAFYNGLAASNDNLEGIAWYAGNSAINGNNRSHPVGQKEPNAWLLFDMLGNVQECCRDRHTTGAAYIATFAPDYNRPDVSTGGVTVDPDGGLVGDSPTSTFICKCGGMFDEWTSRVRCGAHLNGGWDYCDRFTGFRLWLPARFK